jgi:hypothetical protein
MHGSDAQEVEKIQNSRISLKLMAVKAAGGRAPGDQQTVHGDHRAVLTRCALATIEQFASNSAFMLCRQPAIPSVSP